MLNKILVLVKRVFVMRFLLVVAFLVFPSVGFSGMGDVYFCESTRHIGLKDGEVSNYRNEKFKFKRSSNGLIFGSEDGYFKDVKFPLKIYDGGGDLFGYRTKYTLFFYEDGIFTMSQVTYQDVTSMIGKCSVF